MAIAELDLENAEHRELTNSEWRYGDGLVPGEPNGGLVNLMKESPARHADYDDSGWPVCEDIQAVISEGLCFGWYRITVTLPEEVDGVSIAGSQVWFHTCIDDYGEVWVDGEIDLAFGESGRGAASGFNTPQRVVVTESAEPGAKHVIACLAINGPLARPGGGIFLRFAKLEFERE